MDDLLAFNLRWIDRWLALAYDGLHFGDDWGSQASLLIRPAQWRRLFKPRYAEMFRRVKAAGRDVWFHSDGFVNDIAGDLAEIGVDVLNFQVAVTGHDWPPQHPRPDRGPHRHRPPVRPPLRFARPGPGGSRPNLQSCGTSDGGDHRLRRDGPDVPLANIRALYEAFRDFGARQA